MRLQPVLIVLSLFAAPSACTAAQSESSDAKPVRDAAPADVAGPMASFARLIPGAWRVTFENGTSSIGSWDWGPGKHSIRGGELEVYYWHPGRKQVCMLTLHPEIPGIGRGSGEGTIEFDGETADGVFELYQPRHRRKLGLRWTFDGPDKYHDALLEATSPEGLRPLAEWDRFRVARPPATPPRAADQARKPSEHLRDFAPLLGGTWEARRDSLAGETVHVQSTFEWVPDYVHARMHAPSEDGAPTHLLDAYFYQHVGTGALRCLALSNRGAVYEGDLTVLDGGALQLEMKGYEGERVVPYVVRLDLEKDDTLRHRAWSLEGAGRKLVLDVRHEKVEPKGD
jgi:hypothetical protein